MNVSFIRHQRCYNLREDGSPNYNNINPSLTALGIEGAKLLSGDYELIIISPMARCIETFVYSNINGPRVINELFREWRQGPADFHNHDSPTVMCESREELIRRIQISLEYLNTLKERYSHICVITHSEYMKTALGLDKIPDFGECITIEL